MDGKLENCRCVGLPPLLPFASVRMASSLPGTCPEWAANIKEVLFTPEQIKDKVAELAKQINEQYKGKVA